MIFYAYFFCCLSQNNYLCTLIFSHLLNMLSHPTWVRGLKLLNFCKIKQKLASHPTWVRGLKPSATARKALAKLVAPYVGAWIETLHLDCYVSHWLSHPTWVRGLKQVVFVCQLIAAESHPTWVRGLKQSV